MAAQPRNRKGAAYRDNATARSFTEELQQTPSSHAKHSGGRGGSGEQDIARAAPTSQRTPGFRGARFFQPEGQCLFRVWTVEAVRHVTAAVVGVQVAKACPVRWRVRRRCPWRGGGVVVAVAEAGRR